LVAAAVVAARQFATAVVATAVVAAAVVPTALIPAGLLARARVPAGLLARGLVPATGRQVAALTVTAPPVAAGRVALGGRFTLLAPSLDRRAVAPGRPFGRPALGLFVEAQLLGGAVRTEATSGSVAEARCRAVSDARMRACCWFHGVLLQRASRVSSRGRGALVRTLPGGPAFLPGTAALPGLDRLDELTLAHTARTGYAQALRDLLQLGHELRGKASTTATGRLGRRCRRSL
jgi:hypothetical protein